jgi:hypothetical protein
MNRRGSRAANAAAGARVPWRAGFVADGGGDRAVTGGEVVRAARPRRRDHRFARRLHRASCSSRCAAQNHDGHATSHDRRAGAAPPACWSIAARRLPLAEAIAPAPAPFVVRVADTGKALLDLAPNTAAATAPR